MRCIVNVATGGRYGPLQDRLRKALLDLGEDAHLMFWRDELPPGSPRPEETPYAFKVHAIRHAMEEGFTRVIWMDSSVIPVRPLYSLWERLLRRGWWISANPPWNCGEWTCDSALGPLVLSRENAFSIPQVMGTAFGLDFRDTLAYNFFLRLIHYAADGRAFRGPWNNLDGVASGDPRVKGHRHDQTVMSVLAWRMGMELTTPPGWIEDMDQAAAFGALPPSSEGTLLRICR
jgi:hypothetical protein